VLIAELLVAVRQRLNEHECDHASEDCHQAGKARPRTRRAMRIISAFSDDITAIEMLLTQLRRAHRRTLPRRSGARWQRRGNTLAALAAPHTVLAGPRITRLACMPRWRAARSTGRTRRVCKTRCIR
jgi:hypothetical protein